MSEMDIQTLEFSRPNKGVPWGFSIQGGREFGCPLSVLRITSGSIADQLGLNIGDLLVKINNLPTDHMTHQQAILQIQNLNVILELKKSKGVNKFPFPPPLTNNFNNSCRISASIEELPPPPTPVVCAPKLTTASSSFPLPPPPLPFLKELQTTAIQKPAVYVENQSTVPIQKPSDIIENKNRVPTQKNNDLENNKPKYIVPINSNKNFEDKEFLPRKNSDINEKKSYPIAPVILDNKKVELFQQHMAAGNNKVPTNSGSLASFIQNQSNNPTRDSKDLLVQKLIPEKSAAICFVCKDHIKGSYIEANKKIYCNNHFCCTFCGQSITSGKFIETKEGTLYCIEDFTNHVAPKCNLCHKPVVEEQVMALDKCWHSYCFLCGHCKKPIPKGQFHVQEDENGTLSVYCDKDYKEHYEIKCSSCGFPIEAQEKYLLVGGKNMHVSCFKQ